MNEPETEIRLLLADDHQLVRDLVAAHLAAQGGFAVFVADSLTDTMARLRKEGPFDVVLLDLAMPDMAGLHAAAGIVEANGGRPVVLFSGLARSETVSEALGLGFSGFIPKNTSALALAGAIRRIIDGEIYLPEGFSFAAGPRGRHGLTPREIEVLRDIRSGLMNKEIAGRLGLSEVTVKMHVRSICAKLKARNRTQAAIMAAGMMLD